MGVPLFHPIVGETIRNLYAHDASVQICCMIPDYRFGNYAVADPLSSVPRTLNVSRSMCTAEIDKEMTQHTINALRRLSSSFPGTSVEFLPWDATVRTMVFGKDYSSVNGTPDDLVNISGSVIDMKSLIKKEQLKRMVSDRGCHPNAEGLEFILNT
eukprot:CAMPEP_0118636358 /NCGR_PEP_ID=MMETSP0785-20121206/2577_1 /TAXON_ID=91992 /ORGANISM="Bolidomonas pacifica, Strain CCMP 1866" /LENGTH=155 /DNA_ID=CAMNT_0006527473 /DNA_START=203 /DNA_END=667 /DNA_ORIENTATION=+